MGARSPVRAKLLLVAPLLIVLIVVVLLALRPSSGSPARGSESGRLRQANRRSALISSASRHATADGD